MRTPSFPRAAGFTLIELMVTILIATILIIIAVPSYTNQMRQSRRTDAKTAVLDLATREERYMASYSSYTASGTSLGYAGAFPQSVGTGGDYALSVAVTAASPAANPPVPASFIVTAQAQGSQASDTNCYQFQVTNTGLQSSLNSAGSASTSCW
jgi:type IV pilus assembly protein PilE